MLKVKLLRPLDGMPEGETAEYPELDAKRLEETGVVEIVGKAVEAKEAPEPENKMVPAPANKAAARPSRKKAD